MLKLIDKITNGEMCDLCDGGWHELSSVEFKENQLHASVFCVATGKSKDVIIPVVD